MMTNHDKLTQERYLQETTIMLFLLLILYFGASSVSCDRTLEHQQRCSSCPPDVICASEIVESCQKYLICSWDPNIQKHIAHEVHCAFGTFYNRDENSSVLCDHPENVKCKEDPCKYKPDGIRFKDNFGCRGYWECQNGISYDHCCLPFHSLDLTVRDLLLINLIVALILTARHLEDIKQNVVLLGNLMTRFYRNVLLTPNCTDYCEETAEECYLKAVPGHPEQFRSGDNTIQNCSYGTLFSEENCTCVNDEAVVRRCLPVVYEDFASEWSRQYYDNTVDIDPITKKPVFGNGTTFIQVPYFDEAHPANKLMIKTVIKPAKTNGPARMLLVSSCQSTSPVAILLDPQNRKIYIEASTGPGTLNEFMFKFDKSGISVLNSFLDEQYNVRESKGSANLSASHIPWMFCRRPSSVDCIIYAEMII
ncbi:hypothetical protein KUTeg_008413 [Tegillarca granosa]|uniref:Uncharacterized protein n=1 Tax=Tegillarca granosa TaxID=220873 RepID=A0ABQ9F932_TEGGR|nr:hypothetical protein KUTeg_008413 [Tegillarca granosa]